MKDFELNLRSNVILSFFTFLLLSTLFFNSHAKSNDEKIQNKEHKSNNAINKELEYLSKGIKYDHSENNDKVELVTKKIDKPKDTSKENAINKELEYLSKGIKYDYSENNNKVELVTKKIDKPKSISKDNANHGIKYDHSKNNNKVELVTKKINKQKDTSKESAINRELKYLNEGINYENRKSKLKGQIYLRADVGILKSQPKVYKDNFCVNECDNKDYDAGKNYNFGIGWYINNDYRMDLLYNKINLKLDYKQQNSAGDLHYKHKVDISTLMLNLYRYKSISKYFDLYIGGGIGYTRVSPEDGVRMDNNRKILFSAKTSNDFSYSLASGISLKVNNNAELNLGYRFLNYGKVKGFYRTTVLNGRYSDYSTVKSDSLKGHNFSLGIIYKLPKK